MHCFSGDVEIMYKSLALGFYIGIGGPVTYRKSEAFTGGCSKSSYERLVGGNRLSLAGTAISARKA